MALNFQINKELANSEAKRLARGFGLPIVKRAFINKADFDSGDRPEGKSLFGTPLFGTLFIHAPSFETFEYDENNKTYVAGVTPLGGTKRIGDHDGIFADGVIIDVSNQRNIVMTQISGMDGTVKEFINNGDYSVVIKGYFATSVPDKYPEEEVALLNSYCSAPVALTMTNDFLNNYFGISSVVVVNYSFHQQEGVRNVQYFELNCVSDISSILEKRN